VTDLVRVWIVPVGVPSDFAARCQDVLDESERARAAAYLTARDRQRFTVAHGVLRMLAGRELTAPPAALTWSPGRYGKPELVSPWSALHTSLSHSGDMIAAAIAAGRPVGVDIQQLVRGLDTDGLSARFFPPGEAGYVAAGDDAGARADRFAQLWARKEAVVKAAGGRLWPNLTIAVRGCDVVSCVEPAGQHRVADVPVPAGYRAAVALAGSAPFTLEPLALEPVALEPAALEPAGWPGVTGSSPRSRSPRAAGRGSAAARDRVRARTAGPRHPGG
jgi:4'-phosphopantetheinyl transferase